MLLNKPIIHIHKKVQFLEKYQQVSVDQNEAAATRMPLDKVIGGPAVDLGREQGEGEAYLPLKHNQVAIKLPGWMDIFPPWMTSYWKGHVT
jgi:hypothetical protein